MLEEKKKPYIKFKLENLGNNPRDFHGFVNPPVVHGSTVLFPDAATISTSNEPA